VIQLIWAQDEFLATELTDELTRGTGEQDEVLTLVCDGGIPGLDEALFASSLFAARRFVIIRKAETLKKAEIERLATALGSLAAEPEVAVIATSDYSPTPLIKALQDVATLRKLPRPQRGQLVAWVAKRMKAAGLVPDNQAPGTLVEAVGQGLRDLAQAIDQLALRLGRRSNVGREEVMAHFSLQAEQPIWVLFDAIVKHEGPKAFETLNRSLDTGDAPLAILGALVSQVRYLIRTKSLIERGALGDDDLARSLGVSPGRSAVLRRQAARLSWPWLLTTHRLLAVADFEIKGGEDGAVLPAEIILERVVAGALDAS
jgi:DNA polymerase III delta subunit